MTAKKVKEEPQNEALRAQLETCEVEKQSFEARYLRAVADYQNLSRRIDEERKNLRNTAAEDIMTRLIEIVDDLERSCDHLKDPGLLAIYKKLLSTLESFGLERIDPMNEKFDAGYQEAVEKIPGPAGKVCAVYRKGYILHQKVLRPALVAVGSGESHSERA